eukprot:Hpha_TRINITY_DN16007_c3_g1::TRINITY_DN16007_c3_g1_i1::g.117589::m.117589
MPIYPTPDKVMLSSQGSPGASPRRRRIEGDPPSLAVFKTRGGRGLAPRPPPRPPHATGTNPLQHTKIQVQVKKNISKQHQMEDDGLLIHLYNQLHKKTWSSKKEYQGCPGARCPDTVVYEHNFPQHWYHYDPKQEEIQKRPGSFLDTAQIYEFFKKAPPGAKDFDLEKDVVAQYLCSETVPSEDNPDKEDIRTSVEFFTVRTLHDFLHNRKTRPDGVLQRFVTPKGRNPHNFQIQAVWSPRVTALYKRTNMHRLRDHTVGVYERAVTADGPPHYTREDLVSGRTRDKIVDICQSFCTHFESTEKKPVARVVLYFKVDEKDHVWILWASSLRVGATKHSSVHNPVPLSLSTKFATPDKEVQERRNAVEGEELERRLLAKDVEQYRLSGDWLFATTRCAHLPSPTTSAGSYRPQLYQQRGLSPPPQRVPAPPSASPTSTRGDLVIPASEVALMKARPRTAGAMSSYSGAYSVASYSPRRGHCMVASDRAPFLPSPRLRTRVPPPSSRLNPFHQQAVRLGLEGCHAAGMSDEQNESREQGKSGALKGSGGQGGKDADQGGLGVWERRGWWRCDPVVKEKYGALEREEEQVLTWAEELVYHIYSHTLNHGTSVLYICTPPEDIWKVLGSESGDTAECDKLLAKLGLFPYDEDDGLQVSTKEYYFAGKGCASKLCSDGVNHRPFFIQHMQNGDAARPMAALSGEAQEDIHELFEAKRAELRDWAKANCRPPGEAADEVDDGLDSALPSIA